MGRLTLAVYWFGIPLFSPPGVFPFSLPPPDTATRTRHAVSPKETAWTSLARRVAAVGVRDSFPFLRLSFPLF